MDEPTAQLIASLNVELLMLLDFIQLLLHFILTNAKLEYAFNQLGLKNAGEPQGVKKISTWESMGIALKK